MNLGAPCPDNIMMWNAVIFGPGKYLVECGYFKIYLQFSF